MFVRGDAPAPRAPAPPAPRPVNPGGAILNIGDAISRGLTTPSRTQVRSEVPSSGGDYGLGQANAFKQTAAYRNAVNEVYDHQPPEQKQAIVAGALNRPELPESQITLDHIRSTDPLVARNWNRMTAAELVQHVGPQGPTGLAGVAHGIEGVLQAGGKGLSDLINLIPTPRQGTAISEASLQPRIAQYGKNFLKDAVNLPAEVGPSLALPVEKALKGDWGDAAKTFASPYLNAIGHPGKALSEHPLDTYLMLTSILHPATRLVEGVARKAVGATPVNLKQPSVLLTGNLTHERPNLSPYPLIRQNQRTFGNQLYEPGPRPGTVVPRSATVRGRLIKLETSRLVGQNERVRVSNRTDQIKAHAKAVLRSRSARAAHTVKTALQYDPKQALIPGANVLARIADGTIRRPDTIRQDLQHHLQQVSMRRPALMGMPEDLKAHDAYVKELQSAMNDRKFLANPGPAFQAAARYANEYKPLEQAAQSYGHFGDMGAEALQRRALMPAVLTHMPGARYDRDLGMVQDRQVGGKTVTRSLSTDEMRRFVNEQTGGRPVAFTSHEVGRGLREEQDRSFYVNGQEMPRTAREGNTGYAYLHGLTHPGHEALLSQRVRMQGIVDAHRSFDRLMSQLAIKQPNGNWWRTYDGALRDARNATLRNKLGVTRDRVLVPIRVSPRFHGLDALEMAQQHMSLATLDEEAAHRALDINDRLAASSEPGNYALIDKTAADQLKAHENLINPGMFWRANRAMMGQWRRVALGTSFRHLPGVMQELMIRTAASGIGPVSYLAGRAALKRAGELDKTVGKERAIQLRGGTAAGQAVSLSVHPISRHYEGTLLHPPLKAWEKVMAAPGPRQLGTAWRAFSHMTLSGTKHVLEQTAQTGAIGKMVIRDFGSNHGVLARALGTWGQMIDDAAKGILDENKARRLGAEVRRIYGRWTDLTPGEQQALMFSPFGMWWTNSVAWLARFPVDHPILSGPLAAASVGTEQERQKLGLDMFAPGHLPLYLQGGIPVGGGKIWQWNYYSPVGVVNNPSETFGSLIMPALIGPLSAMAGSNPFYQQMTSPGHPHGGPTNFGTRSGVLLNSLAASFVPFYAKAQTIVEGGASRYDTSTLPNPQTKTPGKGFLSGLERAVNPVRLGHLPKPVSSGSSSNGWGDAGSSSNGWGGGSSTGGWG